MDLLALQGNDTGQKTPSPEFFRDTSDPFSLHRAADESSWSIPLASSPPQPSYSPPGSPVGERATQPATRAPYTVPPSLYEVSPPDSPAASPPSGSPWAAPDTPPAAHAAADSPATPPKEQCDADFTEDFTHGDSHDGSGLLSGDLLPSAMQLLLSAAGPQRVKGPTLLSPDYVHPLVAKMPVAQVKFGPKQHAGMVWSVSGRTWEECIRRNLLGTPVDTPAARAAGGIVPGATLMFAWVRDQGQLLGGWVAKRAAGVDLQPTAWRSEGRSRRGSSSPFGMQVPVEMAVQSSGELLPALPRAVWAHLLPKERKGEYFSQFKLDQRLAVWLLSACLYFAERPEELAIACVR